MDCEYCGGNTFDIEEYCHHCGCFCCYNCLIDEWCPDCSGGNKVMMINSEKIIHWGKVIGAIGLILVAITAVTGYTFARPATMADINKTELRLAEASKFSHEEKLQRLQRQKYQNWEYQFQLEQKAQPINPKLKSQEEELNKDINDLEETLENLDDEIDTRKKA